jgi:hypothetical protein
MGERTSEYWVLVWKPKGKRSLGTPGYRWENNIKMELQALGWILIIKPTRYTTLSNLFLDKNSTCFGQRDQDGTHFHPDAASKQSA